MYFILELQDLTKTLVVWDNLGTHKFTLSASNPTQIVSEDEMTPIMERVGTLVRSFQVKQTLVPQTYGGVALDTITEDVTSTLSTRTVTLSATPLSADHILDVTIHQTEILRADWTANPSDLSEITFADSVDVSSGVIEVTYQKIA